MLLPFTRKRIIIVLSCLLYYLPDYIIRPPLTQVKTRLAKRNKKRRDSKLINLLPRLLCFDLFQFVIVATQHKVIDYSYPQFMRSEDKAPICTCRPAGALGYLFIRVL